MNLLIIDDEPIVRDGLKKIIDWTSYGFSICGEASDGLEAIEKIMKLSPELVILDIKIPEVRGTEVAQIVRKQGFKGKIIILSGYSDFEYAKNAIKFGVNAYLLKPIDKAELIEAVIQVRDEIEEESIISVYANQNLKKIKQNFLCDIITGKIEPDNKNFQSYNIQLEADAYQLIMADFGIYLSNNEMQEKFQSMYRNLSADIVMIDDKVFILLKGKKSISAFTSTFEYSKFEFFNTAVYIFSSIIYQYNSIPELYQQVKRTADKKFFYYQGNSVISCEKLQNELLKNQSISFDIFNNMESLYNYILACDNERIEELLLSISTYFRFNENSSEKVVRILINYYVQTKNSVVSSYPQLTDKLPDDTLVANQICEKATLHEIIGLLSMQFNRIVFLVNAITGSNIIHRIKEYIDINLDKPLRLETIAEIFSYNSAYLGKLFKSEIGENFNSYLEKIRIEKSKELLLQGNKVYDTAIKCGFNDMNYFSKKFKKIVGCSPAVYKQSMLSETDQ